MTSRCIKSQNHHGQPARDLGSATCSHIGTILDLIGGSICNLSRDSLRELISFLTKIVIITKIIHIWFV